MRTTPENVDERVRLAMELYAQDQERLHQRLATERAMSEMDIPSEYLIKADEEIRERQEVVRAKKKAAVSWVGVAAFVALGIAGVSAILSYALRPASPFSEDFSNLSESRWTLDRSEGTQAKVSFRHGTAKLSVTAFRPSQTGDFQGRHWATLRWIGGNIGLRKLETLRFRARGDGLDRVRFRFVDGRDSWVTPPVLLDKNWKDYVIKLDHLNEIRERNGVERSDGRYDDRPDSRVAEMQIQTGSFANPVDSRGSVELDDLQIR